MSKPVVLSLVCLLTVGVGLAQEVNQDFGPADFEKFIKEELKTTYQQIGNNAYRIAGTPFNGFVHVGVKFVQIYTNYQKGPGLNLQKMNDWNRDAVYSRVYEVTGKDGVTIITFEGTIGYSAGITTPQLKTYYELLDKERKSFEDKFGIQKQGTGPGNASTAAPIETVHQDFPALRTNEKAGPQDATSWDVEWDIAPAGKAADLRIVSAKFSWKDSKGQPRSIVVVRNLQLVEAFAQYDDGEMTFLDFGVVGLQQVTAKDDYLGPACVGQGEVLRSNHPTHDKKVHKELHYDGLRWMSVYGGDRARRGEKLILWSAIRSVNYVYLMEYCFTDDGRIVCRLGFTAHNYFNRSRTGDQKMSRNDNKDVHAHVGCWRLDFDLSDPNNDAAGPGAPAIKIVRRVNEVEQRRFRIDVAPFPGNGDQAIEGKAKWVAKEFTTLRAVSAGMKNSRGEPISYDLISTRNGTSEDLRPTYHAAGADMDFVNYDFHVTLRPKGSVMFHKIAGVSKQGRAIENQPTSVWYSVPGLHVPRDEDFGVGGQDARRGAALTEWVLFTLRPRDLFDSTPAFTPK